MTPHDNTQGTPCDFDKIRQEETPAAKHLAIFIKEGLTPSKVVDVGAGPGIYVDALREIGVDAVGLELDDRAFPHPHLTKADFVKDTPERLGPGSVAISLEVGEHIAEADADKYVAYLAGLGAERIIFSAAQPGQGGHGHVNCQHPHYWAEKLRKAGYFVDRVLTEKLKKHTQSGNHMGWFLRNSLLLRRADIPAYQPKIDTRQPVLHMIGCFHTVPALRYSHCAFTGKVLRFSKMMRMKGWHVVEYANGASESEANEKVSIIPEARLDELKAAWLMAKATVGPETKELSGWAYVQKLHDTALQALASGRVNAESKFHGDTAAIGSPHHKVFEHIVTEELKKRVQPGDIICHPFGRSHTSLVQAFPKCHHVETGIGYPDQAFGAYRIFESYAWMAYHQGRDHQGGSDYAWVVPNYFDLDEWPVDAREKNDGYLLYFGRVCPEKGMAHVQALAEALDEEIVVVGQGDLGQFAHPRLKKAPAVKGRERIALLQGARALLMPTRYIEPFGGAGVEGQLVGTPLISSDFGCFAETVQHGVSGFRCHTLGDWVAAAEKVKALDRSLVADRARRLYSLQACAERYDTIFRTISDMSNGRGGWYSMEDRLLPAQP